MYLGTITHGTRLMWCPTTTTTTFNLAEVPYLGKKRPGGSSTSYRIADTCIRCEGTLSAVPTMLLDQYTKSFGKIVPRGVIGAGR